VTAPDSGSLRAGAMRCAVRKWTNVHLEPPSTQRLLTREVMDVQCPPPCRVRGRTRGYTIVSRQSQIAAAIVAILLGVAAPTRTSATTFTVNSTIDHPNAAIGNTTCATADVPAVCTLRAAIQAANAHSGDDIINLPPGTYTLSIPGASEDAAATGDLDINDVG